MSENSNRPPTRDERVAAPRVEATPPPKVKSTPSRVPRRTRKPLRRPQEQDDCWRRFWLQVAANALGAVLAALALTHLLGLA